PISTLFPYTTLFRSSKKNSFTVLKERAKRSLLYYLWRQRFNFIHLSVQHLTIHFHPTRINHRDQVISFVHKGPGPSGQGIQGVRSEEHTSELQSREN